MLRYLHAEYLAREDVCAALIPAPSFPSPFGLLAAICEEFGVPARRSMAAQQKELHAWLLGQFEAQATVVAFLDEAQQMSPKMLELIRSILNFETSKRKLIQFVLAGSLDLRDRMKERAKALFSRLAFPSLLGALTPDDAVAMVSHRCQYESIENPFSRETAIRMYELRGGSPRRILELCSLAYMTMREHGESKVPLAWIEALHEGTDLDTLVDRAIA